MQALAFSLDEPDLKTMYLKLLAAASDDRRPYDAHPSFTQIIRELSSDEAPLLRDVLGRGSLAIARLKLVTGPSQWQPLRHHVLNWTIGPPVEELLARCSYVDNWIRLGLIKVAYGPYIAGDTYEWVVSRPEYPTEGVAQIEPTEEQPDPFPRSVGFDKGLLRVTDFGKRFLRAIS